MEVTTRVVGLQVQTVASRLVSYMQRGVGHRNGPWAMNGSNTRMFLGLFGLERVQLEQKCRWGENVVPATERLHQRHHHQWMPLGVWFEVVLWVYVAWGWR